MSKERPWLHLGKMLKAAVITYMMRNKSVDRTLKTLSDEDVDESWDVLGERLARGMSEGVADKLLPTLPRPEDKARKPN